MFLIEYLFQFTKISFINRIETITAVLELPDSVVVQLSDINCIMKNLQTMFTVEMHIINDIVFSVRCSQTSLSERARQKDDLKDLIKH